MAFFTALAIVGVGTQLYGSYQSYKSNKEMSKFQKKMMEQEGAFTKQESIFQALKMREENERQKGTIKAQFAGSGVYGGNTDDVINDVNFKGQRDALWVLYTGELVEKGYITRGSAAQRIGASQANAQLALGLGNALVNFASLKPTAPTPAPSAGG